MVSALFFLLVLLQTCYGAVTDPTLQLEPIDLQTYIRGFDVSAPVGSQRYWIEDDKIMFDLSVTTIFSDVVDSSDQPDFLWEVSLLSEAIGNRRESCSYTVGFVDGGLPHVVRTGSLGIEDDDTTFTTRSLQIWVRGNEIAPSSTHIFFDVQKCFINRYVVRSQFERWNGQAYLMDWSANSKWLDNPLAGISDPLISPIVDPASNLYLDSTMKTGSYWAGTFNFNYTLFTEANVDVVLETFGYFPSFTVAPTTKRDEGRTLVLGFEEVSGETLEVAYIRYDDGKMSFGNFMHFLSKLRPDVDLCETRCLEEAEGKKRRSCLEKCGQYEYYDYSAYDAHVEESVIHKRSLQQLADGIYSVDVTSPMVATTYAKAWDFLSTSRVGVSPYLLDLSKTSFLQSNSFNIILAQINATAFCDDFGFSGPLSNYYYSCTTVIPGTPLDVTARLSMRRQLPDLSFLVNPWMSWNDLVSNTFSNGYTIKIGGEAVWRNDEVLPVQSMPINHQIPIGRGDYKLEADLLIEIDVQGLSMGFVGLVPVYSGQKDYCLPDTSTGVEVPRCQHGGRCVQGVMSFLCFCTPGWEGPDCSVSTNECRADSCFNGGVCVDSQLGYTCTCPERYAGDRCERRADNCPQEECLNGGKCVTEAFGKWKCDCVGEFTGLYCETDVNDCRKDPYACTKQDSAATCMDGNGTYTCACSDNWKGQWCDVPASCPEGYCLNGGTCLIGAFGVPVCECGSSATAKYSGDRCEDTFIEFTTDCRHSILPCQNGGVCSNTDGFGDWKCTCNRNWSGDFCEVGRLCATGVDPCNGNGLCIQTGSSTRCVCAANHFGEHCEHEYKEFTKDCRLSHTTCENGGECQLDFKANQWECKCPIHYTGEYCEVADVCSGANPCANGVCALGTDFTAKCICDADWTGPLCDHRVADYIAHQWSALDCESPAHSCLNNGICVEQDDDSHACHCTTHWEGDRCELAHICQPDPCNGGMCHPSPDFSKAVCYCTGNRVGEHCDETWTDFYELNCRMKPCANGGSCNGDNKCVCPSTHRGPFCELPVSCAVNPCMNGGVCADEGHGAICFCPRNFFGSRCEQLLGDSGAFDPNDCRLRGCSNQGVCRSFKNGQYTCHCPDTHTGPFCDLFLGCDPNPCMNGGQCSEHDHTHRCACAGDFYGPTCMTSISGEISAAKTRLETHITTTASGQSGNLDGTVTTAAGQWGLTSEHIAHLKGEVDAIHRSVDEASVSTSTQSANTQVLYKTYARAQEAEELGRLITLLLDSSSTNMTMSLLVLFASYLFCLL